MRNITKHTLISLIWIPMLQSLFTEEGQDACIVGYLWDKTIKKCIPCSAGYYGKNCEDKCPYPLYGLKCFLFCNCAKRVCHHVDGCKQLPDEYTKTSAPISYERSTNQSTSTIASSQKTGMFQDTMIDTKQNQTLFHPTNTTENKWIRSVMFGIIGLAAVSFLLTMIYLYTHKQWKRQITTMTL
nr:uncharacterized protein LOC117683590 isoform X2 [Crassostrea gigas]